jgi:hypothetical protein
MDRKRSVVSFFENEASLAWILQNNDSTLEEQSSLIVDRERLVLWLMHVLFDVFDTTIS